MAQNPIILHDNARSHTSAVMDLLRLWQWEILEQVLTRYESMRFDLFTKVIESLRGTRYNTRYELIRAAGRSVQNIDKDGRADGVRRLPNLWIKVINKEATIFKVHKCCTPVNKTMSEITNCCH